MEVEYLNAYDLGEAARKLYEFIWGEFCDWYIEFSKLRLYSNDEKRKKQHNFCSGSLLQLS